MEGFRTVAINASKQPAPMKGAALHMGGRVWTTPLTLPTGYRVRCIPGQMRHVDTLSGKRVVL